MKKIYYIIIIFSIFSCNQKRLEDDNQILLFEGWKYHSGDNIEWAKPNFDDSNWKVISPRLFWMNYVYQDKKNGFAWYRNKVIIPSTLKENAYLKDSVQFILGQIDDADQIYLNGYLLGINNEVVSPGNEPFSDFPDDQVGYSLFRRYVIHVDDPRINWDEENTIAIRTHDGSMIFNSLQNISMVDIKDYLKINIHQFPYELEDKDKYRKKISVENNYIHPFTGNIIFKIINVYSGEVLYKKDLPVTFEVGEREEFTYNFSLDQSEQHIALFIFNQEGTDNYAIRKQEIPYILTPPEQEEPRIHGPGIYGQQVDNDFLYRIPASGEGPMYFSCKNLPEGLQVDSTTGIIKGKISKKGPYKVVFVAKNDFGESRKDFLIKVGDKISLTPPMGWNSRHCFGLDVSAEKIKQTVDYMVSSGLVNYGWSYINIDDGWSSKKRTKKGFLQGSDDFPDMKELVNYIHSKGLKVGLYSTPGKNTCKGFPGSYGYEMKDAKTLADWGIDFLKYEWCSYHDIARDASLPELQKPYVLMKKCLDKTGRDIIYSISQKGMGKVWEWGEEVGGHLWKITIPIKDQWHQVYANAYLLVEENLFISEGWNDPGELLPGWLLGNKFPRPTRLTISEQYSQVSLWAIMSAPMILGNDLSKLDDFTL
ncbi:MAG: hypothetical protein ACOCUL_03910, partial [Bacteroidota bacterium]